MSAPTVRICWTIPHTSATGIPRVRGERYDAFLDLYVKTVTRLFPNALLHWENFAPGNGRRILEKYRGQTCTFNDDMQGTGAITLAAAISAVRVCGIPLRHQRVVILGAGTAGVGIADQICDAMVREGLSQQEAARQFLVCGQAGPANHRHGGPTARPSGGLRPSGSREQRLEAGHAGGRRRAWPKWCAR